MRQFVNSKLSDLRPQSIARMVMTGSPASNGGSQSIKPPRRGFSKTYAVKEGVLPVDHSSSPFHELDLEELWKGIGRTRVRQHVNPLRREYQTPAGPVDWPAAYKDPTLPLVIDLGCGPGRFLMLLHKRRQDQQAAAAEAADGAPAAPVQQYNYLGVEIRKPLVERANDWTQRLGYQDQVHYVYSNATISLANIMQGYPGHVDSVYIQFPDPHFKKRHRKRRIFQRDLVHTVRDMLPPGGRLFLQSDVEMVASAMRNCFEMYSREAFALAPEHSEPDAVFFSTPAEQAESQGQQTAAEDGAGGGGRTLPASASSTSTAAAAQAHGQGSTGAAGAGEGTAESSSEEGDDDEVDGEGVGPGRKSEPEDDFDNMQSVWAEGGWLKHNPIGVPTEREHYVHQQGLPVYRVLLVRKGQT